MTRPPLRPVTPGTATAGTDATSPAEQIASQLDLVEREKAVRLGLTAMAYGLTIVFVPLWLALVAGMINLLAEIISMRLMKGLDPVVSPMRHAVTVAMVFLMELCFASISGLIWISGLPYSQPFALGMVMITIIQVTTVRSIHLPHAIAGFAGIALPILCFNAAYWIGEGHTGGLVVSSLCVVGGLAYSYSAMLSNHRTHRALAGDRARARSADEAKTRFIAQISHELRTPLNAIIGMGLAEQARARDATTASRLDILVQAAKGLAVIVDDILDLSALRDGRLSVRPAPVDPLAEVARTVELFRPAAAAAGLVIEMSPDATLPRAVVIDGQRLRQCLSNLLSNAIKHGGQGPVRVRLGWTQGHLVAEVRDAGPGISAEDAAQVFQPFHRGSAMQPGTGLGLSISRAIAEGMGGSLVLLSGVGGAHFRLSLPAPPGTLPAPAETPAVSGTALAGRRILVVDDIATNRLVASAFLSAMGATPVEADSGEAALRLMDQAMADAVLLDMNMPGMSGLDTFLALRARHGRAFPIVAMTADATEDHRRSYLSAGLSAHLPKPISPESLLAALAPLLPAKVV